MKVLIISSGFTDVSFQILSDGEGVFESPQVMQQHFNTFARQVFQNGLDNKHCCWSLLLRSGKACVCARTCFSGIGVLLGPSLRKSYCQGDTVGTFCRSLQR